MKENTDVITNPGDCQQIVIDDLNRQIARLQEQLNEANEVITHYAEKNGYMKAIKYLNKWGVK